MTSEISERFAVTDERDEINRPRMGFNQIYIFNVRFGNLAFDVAARSFVRYDSPSAGILSSSSSSLLIVIFFVRVTVMPCIERNALLGFLSLQVRESLSPVVEDTLKKNREEIFTVLPCDYNAAR